MYSQTCPTSAGMHLLSNTQTMSFSPDGFYPIKVWIDSSNVLGEVQVLNNYAIRPIIVGNFSVPGDILVTSNATTYTCYNRVYISGTALYSGLNLVGNPPVLGATVTVNVPGVGTLTTNTITGGFWSVYYNINNANTGMFTCATPYSYSVTVTDYTLTKTINPTVFSFPCVSCTAPPIPVPYYNISYTTSTCPLENQVYTQTFNLANGTAPSYRDTVRVYADNVLMYTYTRDSIGLGQTATFTSNFTQLVGLHTLQYVHKYTNTIAGSSFVSSTYNISVYVQPNLPDLSWYAPSFQTGPKSFAISLMNYPCVAAGNNKVYLYDSMPGNSSYTLIDSFAVPAINANGGYGISYTRPSWVAGYHHLKLVADVNMQVAERDETNNIYLGLVYVPFPELSGVITGVSNPDIAGGTVVNFTGKIYNNGADAQSFKVQFLVDGNPLGNKVSIASLAGNTNLDMVSPLYTSAADSCPHTVTMQVDVDSEVVELNETNNASTYVLGIDIKQPEACCLVGQSYPFQFQKDVPGNFYGWVFNKGTRHAANVRMKFTYNGNVIGYDYVTVLNAGQYKATGNFNYTFTSAGIKTIRVDYDYPNELCEIDEINNVGYITVNVNQDLPNLVILSQHISPSLLNPNPGQTVNVVATVTNKGSGSAAPSKLRFYYNDGLGYAQLGNDVPINLLLPGRDTTVAATATFAPGSVGLKIIKVGVDALFEITETSEVDNEATRSIVAGAAPDFARSLHEGITFNPNSFAAGDSVTVRNYIRNYGGAAGTAWMRIYVKDSLHNIISVDSVLFNINGVDSALVSKKIKINVGKGYIVTEIVRSSPPEFNEFNNVDSVMFTSIYTIPVAVTVPSALDLTQANPGLFPNWIGGSLIVGNANLTVNGPVTNGDSAHLIITTGSGKLRIVNNSAIKVFPIATSLTSRHFITINNTGNADNFAVNVLDSVSSSNGTKKATDFVNKTWDISEDVVGGSNAKITVTWKAADELPGFKRNNCGIAHFENGNWVITGKGPATDNGDGTFSKTDSGFTSFSPFSVANSTVVLPVNWLQVKATLTTLKQAQINWTVQEFNVLGYEVEKSLNGIDFIRLQTLASKGNSVHGYEIIEALPLVGTAYYRIKQIGQDGKQSYSVIVSLTNGELKDAITIYPNPVKRTLFISGISTKSMVRLMAHNGSVVYAAEANNQNLKIDMQSFAAGAYILEITHRKKILTYQIIKE